VAGKLSGRILLVVDGPAVLVHTLEFLRLARQNGLTVRVFPTASALLFQSINAWAAYSGQPCREFERLNEEELQAGGVRLAAPASVRLLQLLLQNDQTARCPWLLAPALLPEDKPEEVQQSFAALLQEHHKLLLPGADVSDLGAMGKLSLASPGHCLEAALAELIPQELAGVRVLLTVGPTIEDIDPVRFISNRSTGRMGQALARAAARRGALVTMIHGPLADPVSDHPNIRPRAVRSAQEMYDATLAEISRTQVAILCAAVADFTPNIYTEEKIKKQGAEGMRLLLRRTPDILASLGQQEKRPFLVGFAAESNDLELNARHKLQSKHCDILCANDIREPGCGFAVRTNRITMFFPDGEKEELPMLSKDEAAECICTQIARRWAK